MHYRLRAKALYGSEGGAPAKVLDRPEYCLFSSSFSRMSSVSGGALNGMFIASKKNSIANPMLAFTLSVAWPYL